MIETMSMEAKAAIRRCLTADAALVTAMALAPGAGVGEIVLLVGLLTDYSHAYLRGRASWLGMFQQERMEKCKGK